MGLLHNLGTVCILLGIPFFISGTIGLLRFPDIYTRLHALTKADNVGLGFVVLGLSLQADGWHTVARLLLIWLLVLIASSASCHLVARAALRKKIEPWSRP
ncbi:MAG: monovalent cation/H(+) antiporter subunit G [Desulfurivibrio sp.]|nr:MAG: monovalent cation/H(+) antiporter subunit G [Desulfurivibrio sp.]